MKKPTDSEKIQLVAILRLLDCSEESVASILHVSISTIISTELWLRNERAELVCQIIDTSALRATANRELSYIGELDKQILMKAVQVRQEDVLRHYDRNIPAKATAQLVLGFPLVGLFTDGLSVASYACIEVNVANNIEAKGCWAWVQVQPKGFFSPLHWAGTPFTSEETTASRVIIRPQRPSRLDIAVALPPPNQTFNSSNAKLIGEVAAFVPPLLESLTWNGQGCWLAQPLALNNPNPQLEAYLKPGTYGIKIEVGCENGLGDQKDFILQSPENWEQMMTLFPKSNRLH